MNHPTQLSTQDDTLAERRRLDFILIAVTAGTVLGLILLQKQQYAESAKYFRTYLELAPDARDAVVVREQVANLEKQAGPPH